MDAISMLGGGGGAAPLDLTGLSPEEIRGVSAGRINRSQMMNQMVNQLMGFQKMKSTMATQEETRKSSEVARSVSEEKLRQLKTGDEDMTITGPDGKPYPIKRRNLTESLKYIDQAKLRARQGKLADEQLARLKERIPMKIRDASGKEEVYQVPPDQFSAVSKAIGDEKKAKERTQALKDLEGVSLQEMSDPKNYNNLLIANPGAATALLNRFTSDDIGLSDTHYRHYSKLYADYSTHALKKGADESLVETINGLGRKLRHNHMLLNIPSPSLWGVAGKWPIEATKTVTVTLPSGTTIERIYKDAEELGVSVSDILQRIYERQQTQEK